MTNYHCILVYNSLVSYTFIDVKLWISREEFQAAMRGLNHCLGTGVLHTLLLFLGWFMDVQSATNVCQHKPLWQFCSLPGICQWLSVPFLVTFTFDFTPLGTLHAPYGWKSWRPCLREAMPPSLCSEAFLQLLRFTFSMKKNA